MGIYYVYMSVTLLRMRRHVRVPAVRSMGMNSCVCVYYYIGWLVLILNTCACVRSTGQSDVIMESETRLGSALGD